MSNPDNRSPISVFLRSSADSATGSREPFVCNSAYFENDYDQDVITLVEWIPALVSLWATRFEIDTDAAIDPSQLQRAGPLPPDEKERLRFVQSLLEWLYKPPENPIETLPRRLFFYRDDALILRALSWMPFGMYVTADEIREIKEILAEHNAPADILCHPGDQ
jgi:hypothetical protein